MSIDVTVAKRIAAWWAAALALYGFFSFALTIHNNFLMETVSPLLRASYAQRINNYRKKQCDGDYSNQVDLDLAMAKYEELVGRPISDRSCESL